MSKRKILILIQSTDATIHLFKESGLWFRQKSTIEEYCIEYEVYYYTSDWNNYQNEMPNGAFHKNSKLGSPSFGIRHICFYLYLIFSAFGWRNKRAVIRIFGVTLPIIYLLKVISSKKIVISFQYDWAEQTRANYKNIKYYISRWVERSSVKNADFVISTMSWLHNKVINFYGKSETKCSIIPNYVDLNIFYPETKEKIIVFAGRLHWSKGIEILIKSFLKFSENYSDYKLYIFGDGEEKQKLIELADGNSQIYFMGTKPTNEYANYLRKAEVFILPTITMEGHPKALIEAMASGCKCIASDVPGNKDVLTEAGSLSLFKPNDEEELIKKLNQLPFINFKNTLDFAVKSYEKKQLFEKEIKILESRIS